MKLLILEALYFAPYSVVAYLGSKSDRTFSCAFCGFSMESYHGCTYGSKMLLMLSGSGNIALTTLMVGICLYASPQNTSISTALRLKIMGDSVEVTAEKIRRIEVQGARNVAIAAIKAFQTLAEQTKAETKPQLLSELKDAQALFSMPRETEPLMRNAMRYIINQTQNARDRKSWCPPRSGD